MLGYVAEAHDTEGQGAPPLSGEEIVELVASVLLERYPALVAFEDLMAEFEGRIASTVVHDAIDELARLGLVHCVGGFAFASWRAVRARQLGI
jgi:hypothetical protein